MWIFLNIFTTKNNCVEWNTQIHEICRGDFCQKKLFWICIQLIFMSYWWWIDKGSTQNIFKKESFHFPLNTLYKGACIGFAFAAATKFWRAASGWQKLLFTINGWENACVCRFYREIYAAIRLKWQQFYDCS